MCLAVTCHQHFRLNDLRSFTCYCSNPGVERIWKRAGTDNWPWRRKFSCCSNTTQCSIMKQCHKHLLRGVHWLVTRLAMQHKKRNNPQSFFLRHCYGKFSAWVSALDVPNEWTPITLSVGTVILRLDPCGSWLLCKMVVTCSDVYPSWSSTSTSFVIWSCPLSTGHQLFFRSETKLH